MRGFILGNFFLSIFNLAKATYKSISVTDGSIHFDSTIWGNIPIWESIDHVGNYYFSLAFSDFIHPSYWSLFLTVSILFIWLENPFKSKRWVRVCAIVFFLFILFLCLPRRNFYDIFHCHYFNPRDLQVIHNGVGSGGDNFFNRRKYWTHVLKSQVT